MAFAQMLVGPLLVQGIFTEPRLQNPLEQTVMKFSELPKMFLTQVRNLIQSRTPDPTQNEEFSGKNFSYNLNSN